MTDYATPSTDPAANIRAIQSLVRVLAAQREEVEHAYRRGWAECGDALCYVAADAWEAGYVAAEADMRAAWVEVARKVRAIGSTNSRSFAEKQAAELEACKPRPGDFPGIDNDPRCLDRHRVDNLLHLRHDQIGEVAA